jgi:hypothetical protein
MTSYPSPSPIQGTPSFIEDKDGKAAILRDNAGVWALLASAPPIHLDVPVIVHIPSAGLWICVGLQVAFSKAICCFPQHLRDSALK